jgi:hypothetical protein
MAVDARVRDNHFYLRGVAYFRNRAEVVQLGDVGEKKAASPDENYLAVRQSVPRDRLQIARATQIDLHGVAVSAGDIGTSITVPGVGSLAAATVARQLEDQALSLVKLETLPQDIVAAANDSPAVIAELIRAGAGARLVHQVFVVLEMKTALNLAHAIRFEVSGTTGSWAITGTGSSGSSSRTVVSITPATTFAYLLLKPSWDVNLRQDCKRIARWEDDPSIRKDAV